MRVTVVSLNGLQELSGGGLYLRSLVQGVLDTGLVADLTVVSKKISDRDRPFRHDGVHEIELKKNAFLDICARVRLHPTFLGMYQKAIFAACENSDLIIFHNSRCGLILQSLKKRFPGKKILLATDNVEADLMRQHCAAAKGLSKYSARIEEFEICRAEKASCLADGLTFITHADQSLFEVHYGTHAVTGILPITVSTPVEKNVTKTGHGRCYVLFTGHFGFQPNVDSLQVLLQVAQQINEGVPEGSRVEFVVAGAGLDKLGSPGVHGVTYQSSPSVDEMDALFRGAACYLAPVLWGSGMKTKVAEALSYGLPVVAMPNASVGYESLLMDADAIQALEVAHDVPGLVAGIRRRMASVRLDEDRQVAREAFEKWYSSKAQSRRLVHIFEHLGVI